MKYFLGVILLFLGGCTSMRDQGCERFSLRIDTMNRFCQGVAQNAAQAQCSDINDDSTRTQCVSLIGLKALDSCFELVSKRDIEKLYEETCK